MKRGLLAVVGALATLALCQPRAAAGPLILSKDASGHLLPGAVTLDLRSNPDCDQTQTLVPDGSQILADSFTFNVDDKGVGFFSGWVKIQTPDGKIFATGNLHGIAGITATQTDPTRGCSAPGHLEGLLDGAAAILPSSSAIASLQPFVVSFAADVVPQADGVVPLYKGKLVGLVSPPPTPPPPPAPVTIAPAKPQFNTTEPVVAVIANGSKQDIQVLDEQSYCTIVQLQIQDASGWKLIAPCPLARVAIPTVIKAGTTITISLPPTATTASANVPGIYRLVIDWQALDSTGKPGGTSTKAISALFKVVAPPPPVALLKVAPGKPAYLPTEPINAIIANGPTMVRIFDERSLCTIVDLQRFDGTNWLMVGPCPLDRVPIPTYLKPGEVKTVTLAQTTPWATGKYRLLVTYAAVDATTNTVVGTDQTAVSDPFVVQAPPPQPAVTVTSDKKAYRVIDPIIATLANGTTTDIVTWDHRSFCTAVLLLKQTAAGWTTVAPCLIMTATQQIVIKAGDKLMITLPPGANTTPKWEPGTYRLSATFSIPNNAGVPSLAFEVSSDPFTVGAVATTGTSTGGTPYSAVPVLD